MVPFACVYRLEGWPRNMPQNKKFFNKDQEYLYWIAVAREQPFKYPYTLRAVIAK